MSRYEDVQQGALKERCMEIEWTRDLADALDRGRHERKPVFLYFGKDP